MTEFKVGDRVERVECTNRDSSVTFYVGELGTIVSFDEDNNWPKVLVDGKNFTLINDPAYLKLISTKDETKMENKYVITETVLKSVKTEVKTGNNNLGYIVTDGATNTVLLNLYNYFNKAELTSFISELNSILPYLK